MKAKLIRAGEINTSERDDIHDNLSSWSKLSQKIDLLSEGELLKYLFVESTTRKRFYLLDRLKIKYNKVRDMRERKEISHFF